MREYRKLLILLWLCLPPWVGAAPGCWKQVDVRHPSSRVVDNGSLRIDYVVAGGEINRRLSRMGQVVRSEHFTWVLPSSLEPGKVVHCWVAANGNGDFPGWDGRITLTGLGPMLVANSLRNERIDNTDRVGPPAGSKPGETRVISVWAGIGNLGTDYQVDYIYIWSPGDEPPPSGATWNFFQAGAFDSAGNRMGAAAVPWVLTTDGRIFASGIWEGRYTRQSDGSLHVVVQGNCADDFILRPTGKGYVGYKEGKPYRWADFLRQERH
jgi:hypothetical protein